MRSINLTISRQEHVLNMEEAELLYKWLGRQIAKRKNKDFMPDSEYPDFPQLPTLDKNAFTKHLHLLDAIVDSKAVH